LDEVEHFGVTRYVADTSRLPAQDVTVFVHAYDAGGRLIATGDGPPMGSDFPTSLWQNGDRVLDEHIILTLPNGLSLNDVQIKGGLYQPKGVMRLFALQGTTRLPDDAIVVGSR
jgi:hypothetical protein